MHISTCDWPRTRTLIHDVLLFEKCSEWELAVVKIYLITLIVLSVGCATVSTRLNATVRRVFWGYVDGLDVEELLWRLCGWAWRLTWQGVWWWNKCILVNCSDRREDMSWESTHLDSNGITMEFTLGLNWEYFWLRMPSSIVCDLALFGRSLLLVCRLGINYHWTFGLASLSHPINLNFFLSLRFTGEYFSQRNQ